MIKIFHISNNLPIIQKIRQSDFSNGNTSLMWLQQPLILGFLKYRIYHSWHMTLKGFGIF